MEIQIAVSKINKYATSESGDTFEVVERPGGGVSLVLADGQTSGHGAKAISSLVVRKVISLLAEGIRDGAAARAASDYLFSERDGKVSATLNIFSIDFQTKTLVISRNNHLPVYLSYGETVERLTQASQSIGTNRNIRPTITEIPISNGLVAVMFSDGLTTAGGRKGQQFDVQMSLMAMLEDSQPTPKYIADTLLDTAVKLDDYRPMDDISVVVLMVKENSEDNVRRMLVRLPIPDIYQ
jgi:serine phosphatase RsbU (regulator of sigma subunit)